MSRPSPNSRSGFTLIELLIAIAIASISLTAIISVFASAQKTSTSNEVTAKVMQSLRASIGLMESDIRTAGLDRFGSARAGIEVATATSFRFTADRNMDRTINTADLTDGLQEDDLERITYAYDAGTKQLSQCLSEGTADEWEVFIENVENCSFRYYDEDNNLLAFPISIANYPSIRFVEVSITVQRPAGRADDISRTITKRIFCRNMAMK